MLANRTGFLQAPTDKARGTERGTSIPTARRNPIDTRPNRKCDGRSSSGHNTNDTTAEEKPKRNENQLAGEAAARLRFLLACGTIARVWPCSGLEVAEEEEDEADEEKEDDVEEREAAAA